MRAQTILKVATEIVRQQDAFFRRGVHHLRPLVLRDIASAIEMHESTVSRVTTNKFLAAPSGVYELKYFFTSAIANADGGDAREHGQGQGGQQHLLHLPLLQPRGSSALDDGRD